MRKKRIAIFIVLIVFVILAVEIVFIKRTPEKVEKVEEEKLITIGFAQVGAESDWRTANSISIKQTFTPERGYDLIFEDARQNQMSQIKAIRGFIQQEVDYIIFSPVVEEGWDTVLEEAKRAEIPVIIIDRKVNVKDDDLYTSWVGSDFYLQGMKACMLLRQYIETRGMDEVNIVNIQGTIGSTSQIERTRALNETAEKYGWNLVAQESGEYNQAKAYEVMSNVLKEHDDIHFVYCENDNEAFGAIDAIEAAGKTVGPDGDIQIISFDGTSGALKDIIDGKIMMDMECNPLQGPYAEKVIRQMEAGKTPNKEMYVPEEVFYNDDSVKEFMLGGKVYEVVTVTEELIRGRKY